MHSPKIKTGGNSRIVMGVFDDLRKSGSDDSELDLDSGEGLQSQDRGGGQRQSQGNSQRPQQRQSRAQRQEGRQNQRRTPNAQAGRPQRGSTQPQVSQKSTNNFGDTSRGQASGIEELKRQNEQIIDLLKRINRNLQSR